MDNALRIYEKIINGGYLGIKSMINVQEENLFLDFKEKADFSVNGVQNDDKRLFAKILSGFSNASGGVVVWGIKAKEVSKESPDIAVEERPIKFLTKFLTDLNSLISDAIFPLNSGIINTPIYLNNDKGSDEGFLITYVPQSDCPPHRAMLKDNKYYTRAGDNFVLMEHYMLEDSFGRRQRPKLEIYYDINGYVNNTWNKVDYIITVGIKNIGKYLATYPSIKIKPCPDLLIDQYGIRNGIWNLKPHLQSLNTEKVNGSIFIGGINDVIHPNWFVEVVKLQPARDWMDVTFLKQAETLDRMISFKYEIYAEGCSATEGTIEITAEQICDKFNIST